MGVSKSKTPTPAAAAPAAVLVICRGGERDHGGGVRAEDMSRTRLLTLKKPGTRLARRTSEVMVAAERTCMVRRVAAGSLP